LNNGHVVDDQNNDRQASIIARSHCNWVVYHYHVEYNKPLDPLRRIPTPPFYSVQADLSPCSGQADSEMNMILLRGPSHAGNSFVTQACIASIGRVCVAFIKICSAVLEALPIYLHQQLYRNRGIHLSTAPSRRQTQRLQVQQY
jgi:hypothetical protein